MASGRRSPSVKDRSLNSAVIATTHAPASTLALRANRWVTRFGGALVFVVAAALRFGYVLNSPGRFAGNFGYDASVYYTAADALIHGRLPYRDFLLLHPPGLMLVLTPFAGLGQLVGDHAAFMTANAAFCLLAGVNALLVVLIARRMGLGQFAAVLGGLFYGVWFGSIIAEGSIRLEPMGNFALLLGLLALTGERGRRALVLGGVAVAVAASVKIWWIVPALLVLGWQFFVRPRQAALAALAGAAATFLVVDGPFFLAAPRAMWRMLVSDQLDRHGTTRSRVLRAGDLSTVNLADGHVGGSVRLAVLAVLAVLLFGLAASAWRTAACRLAVVLALAQLAVLALAPAYISYYSDFAAVGLALVVAGAAAQCRSRIAVVGTALAMATVVGATVSTAIIFTTPRGSISVPFDGRSLASRVRNVRCLMADTPMALVELDAVSRGLANGCVNWVDVSGRTYDVDRPPGKEHARPANKRWQRDIRSYLRSGDAFLFIRRATGLSAATKRELRTSPVLARSHGITIYDTRRAP
ncbi:hypothetical protein [uncultured Jatrophihabitans sp.]|uniref:hypothetical protein n=1 Tax=uncultured Jatrophihabitans sp. TaxID=1610747 RepID=UPI0035CBB18A